MLKKIIALAIAALAAAGAFTGLSACKNDDLIYTHTHVFSAEWSFDTVEHWHASDCGHSELARDRGGHDFLGGECTVCGCVRGTPVYQMSADGSSYGVTGAREEDFNVITIPGEYDGKPVTFIGEDAFAGAPLYDIDIPDSITEIGAGAFSLTKLRSVDLPEGLTEISDTLFYASPYLAEIEIPEGVERIGNGAFMDCYSLRRAALPESVREIGDRAFGSCSVLEDISLPGKLEEIGDYAFDSCPSLLSVVLPETLKELGEGAFGYCEKLIEAGNYSAFDIDEFVTYEVKNVYGRGGGSNLKERDGYIFYADGDKDEYLLAGYLGDGHELTLPADIDGHAYDIYDYAFNYNGSYYDRTVTSEIVSVTVPDGVGSIGRSAFGGLVYLEMVSLPASVSYFGENAFGWGCDHVFIEDVGAWCGAEFCGKASNPLNGGGLLYAGGEPVISLEIPEGVEEIGMYAFNGCGSLVSVTLPAGLKKIGAEAFGCPKLVEVCNLSSLEIEAGSSENGAVALNALNVCTGEGQSRLIRQDVWLFYDDGSSCYLMAHTGGRFELPSSVNGRGYAIYDYAFRNAACPAELTIPDGVTGIGDYAFYGCNALEVVVTGADTAYIGALAFYECLSLEEAGISAGTASIGAMAFEGCAKLGRVRFADPEGWTVSGGAADAGQLADPETAARFIVYGRGAYGLAKG